MSDTLLPETIALFYKGGSSDKEYHVHLKQADGGWLVEIQYGKRGSSLKSSLKTKSPIDYPLAKKTYDKTVNDQLKDGYTPAQTGVAYQDTPREKDFTGLLPQLLNAVEEDKFGPFLLSDEWMLQEKFDGQRLMLSRLASAVEGINRNGIRVAVPTTFEAAMHALPAKTCLIDGEWLGDRFAPFDLLELDGVDLRPLGAKTRKAKLDELLLGADDNVFLRVETAFDTPSKMALHDHVKAHGGEGVVAKKINEPYVVGRPNSGGSQLKRKFVESATMVVVAHHATKRSISVGTIDPAGARVQRGSVTIPPNYGIPDIETIVEVQYLYAYPDGSIYQPVYKGPRVDQGLAACICAQLKFKSDGPAATKPKGPRA